MTRSDTANQLLDAAQQMIQERGHNSFSYKDLAAVVNIRTASIHYHFPTKADLGEALVHRYLAELEDALADIDRRCRSNRARLKKFIALYRDTEDGGCICLCGSLASDLATLPVAVQDAVAQYLTRSQDWVTGTIKQGVVDGEFELDGKPTEAAAALLASLQGGLLLARSQRGPSIVDQVQRTFMHSLRPRP